MKPDNEEIERSSGNVFTDLGLPDAETHLLKAQLVTRIDRIIRQRGLKQVDPAKLPGLSQRDVSRLLRGNFQEYSMERLLRLLTALGRGVNIVIRKSRSDDRGDSASAHEAASPAKLSVTGTPTGVTVASMNERDPSPFPG